MTPPSGGPRRVGGRGSTGNDAAGFGGRFRLTAETAGGYRRRMRPRPPAVPKSPRACFIWLFLFMSPAAAGGPPAGLTTEALHARSPLAAALGVRVREPVPLPGLAPPRGDGGPSALRRALAPRNAAGLFTRVVGGDFSSAEFDARTTHGLRGAPPFVTLSPGLNLLLTDGPSTADSVSPLVWREAPSDDPFDDRLTFAAPDLPGALWGVNAELMAFMPLSRKWAAQAAVAPGVFTDFANTSGDAFRMPARVLGIYTQSPRTQWTVGAVFLDREDVTWLPALGVIHRPTDRTTLELILPRPRVVHRFWGESKADGGFGYLAGELGGGSWAVERTAATGRTRDDVATLSDLRLLAGFEVKRAGRVGLLAETGWAFARGVEYESGLGDADFDDAWLFRVGVRK